MYLITGDALTLAAYVFWNVLSHSDKNLFITRGRHRVARREIVLKA
jgi:hypothetical protein